MIAHVIDDRARRAVALRDRHPPYRPHVDEEVLDRLAHQMRAGEADDRLMKRDVRVRIFLDVLGRRRVAELVEHVAQRENVTVRGIHGREPRRHAFERGPHLDHFHDLLLGLANDENAAPRNRAQKSFLLEQRHRFADGRAADAERLAELPLIQAYLVAVRIDVGVHDRLLQRRVGLVAEAHVGD